MESPLHLPTAKAEDFDQLAQQCSAIAKQLKRQDERMQQIHADFDIVAEELRWCHTALAMLLKINKINGQDIREAMGKETFLFVREAGK